MKLCLFAALVAAAAAIEITDFKERDRDLKDKTRQFPEAKLRAAAAVVASTNTGNGQASPKTASVHDVARDKPTELKTEMTRGGDISLRSDAGNTETAQLLQLVKDLAEQVEDMKTELLVHKDLAEQVEDMKTELLVQKDYVKTISTVLNIENITDLDAEIERVAEEVYERHVPIMPEPPQDDPSAGGPQGGPPGVSGLELSASTGLGPGDWCLYSRLYLSFGKDPTPVDFSLQNSAYYFYATDSLVDWQDGCDKCPDGISTTRYPDDMVWPMPDRVNYWVKCN